MTAGGGAASWGQAGANIALIKYWGKRSVAENLPETDSLSLTLRDLRTRTQVTAHDGATDVLVINGEGAGAAATERAGRFAHRFRQASGRSERVRIESETNFPVAAGLASSASGFAALTMALDAFFELGLSARARSEWARVGSGSAARSIFGGWVHMHRDGYAAPTEGPQDIGAVVAAVRAGPKAVGSTEGMERTRATSPLYSAWVDTVRTDLPGLQAALRADDFDRLADIAEGNCLAMHATALAARPSVYYFQPVTHRLMAKVRALRSAGVPVFFSIDAGPHVVAFARAGAMAQVAAALEDDPDVAFVRSTPAGPGASSGWAHS